MTLPLRRPAIVRELRELAELVAAQERALWLGRSRLTPDAACDVRFRSREEAALLVAAAPHIGDLVLCIEYLASENEQLKIAIAGDVAALRELRKKGSQ